MRSLLLSWSILIAQLSHGVGSTAESPVPAVNTNGLDYMVVVTGGELLEGVYPDMHTQFITRTLKPVGGRCLGSILVDDQREDILNALRFATTRASLVIVTGGLGPTPNDITRDVLSEFTGVSLEEKSEVLAGLEKRFNQNRAELRSNLRRQTRTPQGGGYLKNPNGTAVGLIFRLEKQMIIALPGPPRELQPMVAGELLPFLQRQYGVRSLGRSLTLRFVGLGQSAIDQTIKDRVRPPPDIVITSLFEGSRVDFTFTLPGHGEADGLRLKALEKEIAQYLGEYLYADDGSSLEEVVLKQLQQRVHSLVLVEIGSGGHLAASLNAVSGMQDFLKGAYLAPSESQMRRLLRLTGEDWPVSTITQERMQLLAKAALREAQSEFGVAVSPIELDAAQTPGVWICFGPIEKDWVTQKLSLRDSGEIARSQLATSILDRLRRALK